jgi:hypothetical protein
LLVENGATLYPDFDKEGDEEFIVFGRKITMKNEMK